jgi:DNA-binding IclR family transcriptional regulator
MKNDKAAGTSDGGGSSSVQSLARGLAILSQFSGDAPNLSLTELSRRTGLHRATVYRFIKTMENEGYLVSTASGSYGIGPAWAMQLYSLGSETVFAQILSSDIRALADSSQETVALGVRQGDTVNIVHALPPARSFVPTLPSNRIASLYVTWNVHAQILLALASEEARRKILDVKQVRFTEHTVVDPHEALARLERVRQEGVAYDREEFHLGTCAVGVPVMSRNKPVAVIALVVPVERFTDEALPSYIEQLRATAGEIEKRFVENGAGR